MDAQKREDQLLDKIAELLQENQRLKDELLIAVEAALTRG